MADQISIAFNQFLDGFISGEFVQGQLDQIMNTQQGMDVQSVLAPFSEMFNTEKHSHHRRLAVTEDQVDSQAIFNQCTAQANAAGGTDADKSFAFDVCKITEMTRLWPDQTDRDQANGFYDAWAADPANNATGTGGTDTPVDPSNPDSGNGTTDDPNDLAGMDTTKRIFYIVLFIGMWGCLAFPIIYDIVVVTAHFVTIFTPTPNPQDEVLKSTMHPEFYLENIYDPSITADMMAEPEWSAWTIWNCTNLLISAVHFGFEVYIIIAIIIEGVKGFGSFQPSTALLNEPWNMYIFWGLNALYFVSTFMKFWIIQLTLEKFNVMEDDILYYWNELKFYVWNPSTRLELEIEGYAEIVKEVVILANFFIYWQMPEVFTMLMAL